MSSLLPAIASYVPPTLVRTILADPKVTPEPTVERFPAAVLFADVSSFTLLTEALAQKGPEGPEELSRVLNRYFGRMIDLLAAEGGEVVKFSGDALTVIFPAEGVGLEPIPLAAAVRHALQAAVAMQAAMVDFAALPTSIGPIALGMKIGVGAGEVRAMQVGGVLNRWEYVIAGEPVQQATAAEKLAERGEVLLSPAAAAVVGPAALPPCPLAPPDWSTVADPPALEARLRCYLAGPVLSWLDEGLRGWLPVLRSMSVLFAGVSGLDCAQPEAVGQLHAFLRAAQEVIYRYEGTLRQLVVDDKGTVLVVLFGAPPFAHEDDAVRAVRCALDLVAAQRVDPLSLAVGVTTGRVFAGPVGSETRREYAAVGDTVNLASRLMGQAGAGNVLCDFDTYRQARGRLAFESLPPLRVKGKAGLVRVYRPGAPLPAAGQRLPVGRGGMIVGRQAEMSHLEGALDAVEAGESRVLLLSGEAGIGKSRLVTELTRLLRERGLAWLLGAGQSIESQTPYRGWRDVFSFYFGLDGVADPTARRERVQRLAQELVPAQVQRLPLLNDILSLGLPETDLTASLDPALRQQSLFLLLLALLRAWTREQPLVVVLEDAQWLDSVSWELAVYLARALTISRDPLLMVLVTRPLDESSVGARHAEVLRALPEAETLALTALTAEETVALAAACLGLPAGRLPLPIADLVCQRAGGNPFFAEELVLALRDQGVVAISSSGEAGGEESELEVRGDLAAAGQALPDTLQGLILARIDRLLPERQLTLKVGAVIGHTFAYRPLRYTLQRHTSIDDAVLRHHLDALAALDLTPLMTLEPELSYTFKHIVIQEVAYQTLLFAQRRALHRTVAGWYETAGAQQAAPLLAYHYRQAEDGERERRYARLAGEQAAARFAHAEAVAYLGRALELTLEDDRQGRYALLLAREQVYDRQGAREEQRQDLVALQELAAALGDGRKLAEVTLHQTHYAEAIGNYPAAIVAAQVTVELAQAGAAAALEAAGHLQWGRALWRLGSHEAARHQLEQALDIVHAARAEAAAPATAGPGDPAQLQEIEADSRRNLGNVCLYQGDYAAARSCYEQALGICREIGDRPGESALLNNLGSVAANMGDYAGARAYFEKTLAVKREIGDRQSEGLVLNNLGGAATNLGDYAGARDYFEQALDICREIGDRRGEGTALNNLGVVAIGQGDLTDARAHCEQALRIRREIGDRPGEGTALNNLGIIAVRLGDYGGARSLLEEGLRVCREIGHRRTEGEGLAYLGLLAHSVGDDATAQEHCQQALQIAQGLGAPHVQGYALTFLGHALARLGRLEEAVAAYRQALEIRQQMGQANLMLGPLAGLAEVALTQGDQDQAQAYVEEILDYVQANGLAGTDEPFRVYLACIRVLQAGADPRAGEILAAAHRLLQEQAGRIADEDLRRSFLEGVAAHREIGREFERVR